MPATAMASQPLARLRAQAPVEQSSDLPPPWDGEIDTGESFFDATWELCKTDPQLSLAVARRALEQALARGDVAGQARALVRIAGAEESLGLDSAAASWTRAYERIEQSGNRHMRRGMLHARIADAISGGDYVGALTLGQTALEAAAEPDEKDGLATLQHLLAHTLIRLGEHDFALQLVDEARRAPRYGRLTPSEALPFFDDTEALLWLEHAVALTEAGGDPTGVQVALDRARNLAERACTAGFTPSDLPHLLSFLETLVREFLTQGDAGGARTWVRRVFVERRNEIQASRPFSDRFDFMTASIDVEEGRDLGAALARLQTIERSEYAPLADGEMKVQLLAVMARAFERNGELASALDYHKRWAAERLRLHALRVDQRIKVVRHLELALRGEGMEFLAHDLRGPLASALQRLQDVPSAQLPEPVRAGVEAGVRGVQRAAAIAEHALGIMRAEHMQRSELLPVSLSALVDDVCEAIAPLAGQPVRLARDIEPGLQVAGDIGLLSRALGNLIDNALRHAPAGSSVRVGLQREDGSVVLSVSDDGPGLPEPMQRRLFQRYSTGRAGKGSGLGLALVARVARLHGASIELASSPGKGTRIALRLRLAEPA